MAQFRSTFGTLRRAGSQYYNDASQETTLKYLFMGNYGRVDSFAHLPATKQFPAKGALDLRSVVEILVVVLLELSMTQLPGRGCSYKRGLRPEGPFQ